MTREDMIDLLKSLSKIEGAVCTADEKIRIMVEDELAWCVEKLTETIREEK